MPTRLPGNMHECVLRVEASTNTVRFDRANTGRLWAQPAIYPVDEVINLVSRIRYANDVVTVFSRLL